MRIPRTAILLALVGFVACGEKNDELDTSNAFMEAAQALFADKEAIGGIQNIASKFMESDAGKQFQLTVKLHVKIVELHGKLELCKQLSVGDMLTGGGKTQGGGVGHILSGLGSLIGGAGGQRGQAGQREGGGLDLSMLGSIVDMVSSTGGGGGQRAKRESDAEPSGGGGLDFESMLNVAGMFMGSGGGADGMMGLLPMLFDTLGGGSGEGGNARKHDHSSHSWYMPPVLENIHVMWEHFSNSELGQTLWKNSGLANIVGSMTDKDGRIKYETILDSFENPRLRRRWIRSLTNFVSEWIAHISDPTTQHRYLTTIQFVGNSFLKSQGYPKGSMFDTSKPAESLSRVVNTGAKRHLNMQVDSIQYIKPAVAYIQDLFRLASEKGFIMSRVNANELSNRLSETINNDLISPLLKAYRAYKWSIKSPKCAHHILCTINQKSHEKNDDKIVPVRESLTKFASFPAAWTVSVKTGISFWSLYGAIQESDHCFEKYPVDCSAFHEEEMRVTTEAIHNEL